MINATVEAPCDGAGILELKESSGSLVARAPLELRNVIVLDRLIQGYYRLDLVSSKAYCHVISTGLEFRKIGESCLDIKSKEFVFHLRFELDQFLLDHPDQDSTSSSWIWRVRFVVSFTIALILTSLHS